MTYINKQWLDTCPDGCFFTNREMIANPEYKPQGWFDPFTEPDKLADELKHLRTAKEITEHLETFYPGIDPEPYRKKKIADNKKRDIKYCCTTWVMIWSPIKQEFIKVPKRCKHWNDCPRCREWKREQNRRRLKEIRDKRLVIAKTKEEENEIKAGKSQNDYLRILRSDGTTAFILNEAPQNRDEMITHSLIDDLAEDMLPNEARGRFSGRLGKQAIVIEKPEKQDNEEEIEVNAFQIRFTEKSTIDTPQELEEKVIEAIPEINSDEDIDTLRLLTKEADKALDRVCSQHKIDKQFLYRETIYIDMKEVEWKWLSKKE